MSNPQGMRQLITLIFLLVAKISFAQTGYFFGLADDSTKTTYLIRLDIKGHKTDTIKSIGKFYAYYALTQTYDPQSYVLYADLQDSFEKQRLVGVNVLTGN